MCERESGSGWLLRNAGRSAGEDAREEDVDANELGDEGEMDSESDEKSGTGKQTLSNAIPLSWRVRWDLPYIE